MGLGATGKSLYEQTTRGDGTKEHSLFLFAGGHHGGSAVALKVVTVAAASSTAAMKYFHTDHLGSVTAISDDYGRVSDPTWGANASTLMDYDAWGARRNPDGTAASSPTVFDQPVGNRGFTGHEAIPDVGLVNMNGRVYDPVIGRFLSPDPNVQFAANLQSYNRYSYVLNNPLSLTDPTGYFSLSGLGVFNIVLGVVGVVTCAETGGFGCGLAFAALSATINTVAMHQAGMAWDQAIGVNLIGLAAGMTGGIIGGALGGAVGGGIAHGLEASATVAEVASRVVGGAVGGMMGATFASLANGGSISGDGLLSAAFQGAVWAGASYGWTKIQPVTQGSAQGGQSIGRQQEGSQEDPTGMGGLGAEKVPSPGQRELRGNWKLSQPSVEGGHVVQRVHFEIEIDDANGNVVAQQSGDYYEAWKVNAGKDRTIYYGKYPADDTFAWQVPANSHGYWTTTGSAQFYDGLKLPNTFGVGKAPMAGPILPSTQYGVTPMLPPNNTTPVNRAYTNFW